MINNNMEASDAFNQLSQQDQKSAIDVAIAAIVIGLRIPSTGKPLYDWMATEFASGNGIPPNIAKYALRSLGRILTAQDWELIIKKRGEALTTSFLPHPIESE